MATEKITIAELDIDVDAVLKSSQAYLKQINELKASQKQLTESGQENSKAFVENAANLNNLNKSYRDSQKFASSLLAVNKNLEKTLSAENKTVQELRNSRNQLIAISSQITGNSEKEIALREKLNGAVDKQTKAIRDQSSEFGASKDKIGEYQQAIEKAVPANSLLGRSISFVKDALNVVSPIYDAYKNTINESISGIANAARGTEGLTKAQKAQAIATNITVNALRLFKVALAATGIGLILVALGSLVAFLSSTQEGVDKVNAVLKPLQVIFSRLFGVMQKFGKAIFEAFENPKQLISDLGDMIKKNIEVRFNAVLRIFDRIVNFDFKGIGEDLLQAGTGVENIGEKTAKFFGDAKDFLNESIALGKQLADLQIEIETNENAAIVRVAELNKLIKEQNKIAEDTSLSQEEREQAAIRTIEASKDILAIEQSILDKKIQQKEIENSLNDTSREDQKELNELIASRIEKETQALELQTTQTNKLNTIRREIASTREREAKEAADKARDAALLEVKNAEIALEIYKETNAEKLAADGDLNQARIDAALSAASFIKDAELSIIQDKLDKGIISENEAALERLQIENNFNARRTELDQEFFDQQEEKRKERAEAEKERKDFEAESAQELRLALAENDAEFQQIQLDLQKEREIAAAEKIGAETTTINKRYAKLQKDLDDQIAENKLKTYAQAFGGLAALLKENTALAKILGIAQATIDTYIGANNALKLTPPLGGIAAGVIIATGLANVGKIAGVKLEKGGLVEIGGKRHAQGGTKFYGEDGTTFEAEKGELIGVLNRNAAANFNLMNRMHPAGSSRKGYYAGGGVFGSGNAMVQNRFGGGQSFGGNIPMFDYDLLGAKVAEANMKLPPPRVGVDEITRVSRRVEAVEQGANV